MINKEELTTLQTSQRTSHCSCLEHCFLFRTATVCGLAAHCNLGSLRCEPHVTERLVQGINHFNRSVTHKRQDNPPDLLLTLLLQTWPHFVT